MDRKVKVLFLLFSFIFSGFTTSAQSFLYLKKLGGSRSTKYLIGDEIKFQLKGDPYFTTGAIESFGTDYFVIFDTPVFIKDIARIDIRKKNVSWFSFRSSPNKLFIAGIFLPIVDIGNQLITEKKNSVKVHKSIWLTSIGLVVSGIGLRIIAPKYFELGYKRKAVIINSTGT